jgi:hypothetical protein
MTDKDLLALFADKHREQVALYYTRMGVMLTLLTLITGGVATVVVTGAGRISDSMVWFLVVTLASVGSVIATIALVLQNASHHWIEFWNAKIVLYEWQAGVRDPAFALFLDRQMEVQEDDILPGLPNRERVLRRLKRVWQRRLGTGVHQALFTVMLFFACSFVVLAVLGIGLGLQGSDPSSIVVGAWLFFPPLAALLAAAAGLVTIVLESRGGEDGDRSLA